jgi:hypothetical protein
MRGVDTLTLLLTVVLMWWVVLAHSTNASHEPAWA